MYTFGYKTDFISFRKTFNQFHKKSVSKKGFSVSCAIGTTAIERHARKFAKTDSLDVT